MHHSRILLKFSIAALAVCFGGLDTGSGHPPKQTGTPKAAPIPRYAPAKTPVVTGEFIVGVVNITFKETVFPEDITTAISELQRVTDTKLEADPTGGSKSSAYATAVNQEEYFKIYSNDIAWPKLAMMPDEKTYYQDPNFYGYYCEFDAFENPIGWKDAEEGGKRVEKMNQNAFRFAAKNYRGARPRFICYNYITKRDENPSDELTAALFELYPGYVNNKDTSRKSKERMEEGAPVIDGAELWEYYAPVCKWGEPAWPNSKIQINDFGGGVLAHELGHCLGAPDVYRVGRFNDGIGGSASLLGYGPTANAFSRFYHHAYIKEQNHPTIKTSGTYTLHPRHIKPAGTEALGYLIPSNHPHYMYHVEYIHKENGSVGVGPSYEGMLISVVNLGLTNYLGSPDYTYVYRPNDQFFRGLGDTEKCLFGKAHGRTEFNMKTEPSTRLPNLIDGGVYFKNIEEKNGTLTFDLTIDNKPITGSEYTNSMLPQIRLDEIYDVQSTSMTMDCTIKFRGEPLKTIYGFCWGTSKNPTIKNDTYILAHRECYRGHAINLTPNTTYYIRAFASNGLGVRYSDEEKTVKTTDDKAAPTEIKALLTDGFSNNEYLVENYSIGSSTGINYSPICTMAKLVAYYRPENVPALSEKDQAKSKVDFNQLNWNPQMDHSRSRLEQVDGMFYQILSQTLEQKLHELKLVEEKDTKKLLSGIRDLTGVKSKPVLTELTETSSKQVSELIKADLLKSRPALMIFAYQDVVTDDPSRWALIDGLNGKGEFHFDFPAASQLFINANLDDMKTDYYSMDKLMLPGYKIYVVTSCYFDK
jgi:hypothetical protein